MDNLITEAEKYVISFLNENLDPSFIYHNIIHTMRVVEKTKELIEGMQIEGKDAEHLIMAAWFHDTGLVKGCENHESESANIAEKFLKDHKIPSSDIKSIKELILATKIEYEPTNVLEGLIRDADCSHLASKNFSNMTELLRKEMELTSNKSFNETEWLHENIEFFTKKHRYYTDFASSHWDKAKGKNLAQLLKANKKLKRDDAKLIQKKDELKFKRNKVELPERGIETMFRVTLKNHMHLSNIADTKANILLSVNAIIVSLVLANLIPKLDNPSNTYLIYPTLIFVLFTTVAIILSVLATRPNVTRGKFTKEDVENKKVNLLFFGNFHKMKLQDFEWAMNEMMQDKDYLYSSMTKDLYFLGKVLDRKYKILRITYTIFIIGIIVSVAAFAVAFKYVSGTN
jgi:predicted metal-dependent HD superfamily phosphohydrolase